MTPYCKRPIITTTSSSMSITLPLFEWKNPQQRSSDRVLSEVSLCVIICEGITPQSMLLHGKQVISRHCTTNYMRSEATRLQTPSQTVMIPNTLSSTSATPAKPHYPSHARYIITKCHRHYSAHTQPSRAERSVNAHKTPPNATETRTLPCPKQATPI